MPRLRVIAGAFLTAALCYGGEAWLGPSALACSPDGRFLYVAGLDGHQVVVVDLAQRKVMRRISVPGPPSSVVVGTGGDQLYVACGIPAGRVVILRLPDGRPAGSIAVGHTPSALALSPDGKRLYVANRFDHDISVIDVAARRQAARVTVRREPVALAITPDGGSVLAVNLLPADRADTGDTACEVTVIDAARLTTSSIRLPNGSTGARGVAISPDGKQAYVTHLLARYQMPTTQLDRGWMNTNALSVIDLAGKKWVNTVLLDEIDLGAANPWGVAVSPEGRWLAVAHAGSQELSVIDTTALLAKLRTAASGGRAPPDLGLPYPSTRAPEAPDDLAFLVGLRRRIPLPGNGPRALIIAGGTAFAGEYFTDTLAAVPLETSAPGAVEQIPLGSPPAMSPQRRGERLFHDAALCFQQWQSCASCHPDARVDALNWDLLNDGIGNPKNTKSMLLAHRTPPAMSLGVRASAEVAVRAGLRHIQFAERPEEDAAAIDEYLKGLAPVPSPRLRNGRLSPAAERGRKLFFDSAIGCARCHPAPLYTDLKMYDMGSRSPVDGQRKLDTPTLIEVWRTAPYLHDGRYSGMKEVFTHGGHGLEGRRLTEDQINDLVEFVLSL